MLRHDASRTQHNLRPLAERRCSASWFHSAESTAVRELRAAGGISHGCDYSSQKHGCPIPGPIRPDASALPVADIERDAANTATARTKPALRQSGRNAANHKQLLRFVWERDAAGERAPAGPEHGRYDRCGSTSCNEKGG